MMMKEMKNNSKENKLKNKIASLKLEIAEYERAAKVRRRRQGKAKKLWQKETGNKLITPDTGQLFDWLVKKIEKLEKEKKFEYRKG